MEQEVKKTQMSLNNRIRPDGRYFTIACPVCREELYYRVNGYEIIIFSDKPGTPVEYSNKDYYDEDDDGYDDYEAYDTRTEEEKEYDAYVRSKYFYF